jgi:putative spermidine/putrescine transport system permease protein
MARGRHTRLPARSGVTANGRRPLGLAALLLGPIIFVNLVTFVWPMLNLAAYSFRDATPSGAIGGGVTLATWIGLAQDPFYAELVWLSVWVSLLITALTLIVSYPIALVVHRASPRWRNLLIIACISPLLVSAVVRTYGWLVILGDHGFVPSVLRALGVQPPKLIYNMTGVVIGLTEILMPYMILSLLAGFGRLSDTLEEAAASLGAPPWRVLYRVVVPLTLPGILLGCLLAFVLAVSSFITPQLLGGGRVILLATEIYQQAIVTLNWPVAAALSLLALVVFGAALLVYGRVVWLVD